MLKLKTSVTIVIIVIILDYPAGPDAGRLHIQKRRGDVKAESGAMWPQVKEM